jgi:hypothetical protein
MTCSPLKMRSTWIFAHLSMRFLFGPRHAFRRPAASYREKGSGTVGGAEDAHKQVN